MDKRVGGRTDGWMEGQRMDGWMERWTDGRLGESEYLPVLFWFQASVGWTWVI